MGAVAKWILIVLKYAVQIGPLIYEGSKWAIKLVREWRKVPAGKDEPVAPPEDPPADVKIDPG